MVMKNGKVHCSYEKGAYALKAASTLTFSHLRNTQKGNY